MANVPLFDLTELKQFGGLQLGSIISRDPLLEIKIAEYQARTIKEDFIATNLVFKTGLSAYTSEPINLFLRGPPSIGKTFVVINTVAPFPEKDVWPLAGLSPKAIVHDEHAVLVDENNEPIEPMEKPGPNATVMEREAWSNYKKRLRNSHYLVDLQGKIIIFLEAPNEETFNQLRPLLSHDKFEITYRFSDTSRPGSPTKVVVLRGWPATIWLSTEENYIQDFSSRSLTYTPTCTETKYGLANIVTAEKFAMPWKFEKDQDAMEIESYLRWFKETVKGIGAVIPYAEEFAKVFPHKFPRSMRDFKHILGLMQVSALFNLAQRPLLIREISGKVLKYVMACESDYTLVIRLWEAVREQTETSSSAHHMTLFHEIIEPLGKESEWFTINDLVDLWNTKYEDHKSSDTMRKWVDFLCSIDWLSKEEDPNKKSQNRIKVTKKENGEYRQSELSTFFTLDSFKAWLNELEQISEENHIAQRESLLTETEASAEEIYQKYFASASEENAVILLGLDRTAKAKATIKEKDNPEIVQYPKVFDKAIVKLERLTTNIQDKCALCVYTGRMDWQATLTDESYRLLCGPCGDRLQQRHGEVEG